MTDAHHDDYSDCDRAYCPAHGYEPVLSYDASNGATIGHLACGGLLAGDAVIHDAEEENWTPQEQASIAAAADVDLGSAHAKQVRAFLVKRYGADMVTDEQVAVTVAAQAGQR